MADSPESPRRLKRPTSKTSVNESPKRRKAYVEVPRLRIQLSKPTPTTSVAASEVQTTSPDVFDTSLWDVKKGRNRSLSVDSTSESGNNSESSTTSPTRSKWLDSVEITPWSNNVVLTYQRSSNEIAETEVTIPGELSSFASSSNHDIPVRRLTNFIFYDSKWRLVPFEEVLMRLSSSSDVVLGSGMATSCSETGESPPSTSTAQAPILGLSPIIDYWTDYTTRDLVNLWQIRVVAVKTRLAWYILQAPADIYASSYQPFWVAHFITWRVVHALRQKPDITRQEFFAYLKKVNDQDFLNIMGREIIQYDLSSLFVATYLLEQLDTKNAILKYMLQLPLVQEFARQGASSTQIVPLINRNDARTVVTPRIFSIAQYLFHPLLFVDEEKCLSPPPKINNPPLLHPDDPSKISWGSPIPDHSADQLYSSICIDGITYKIGDCIMVKPGVDDLAHRALNAKQRHSVSHQNDMGDCVWFCKIQYMFDSDSSRSSIEPLFHVQWFEHSSKTLLQEMAHPLELFALYECDDIAVGSVLGLVDVAHPDLNNLDPNGYYCRFIWDSENSSFIQYSPLNHSTGSCGCCEKINQRELSDSTDTVKCSSEKLTLKNGMEYHVNDFVYVFDNADCLHIIGQILKFSGPDSTGRWKVRVLLFGRFDDVARLEDNQARDERRLFRTDERLWISPTSLQGKCWIANYDEIDSEHGLETFYVDRWAPTRICSGVSELRSLKEKIQRCALCLDETRRTRDERRTYKRDHVPLRMMELFAGAGGLSTGLEQSGFTKSYWAVELSPSAAATFQANHDDAIVYNEDTNICLLSALDEAAGKPGRYLKTVKDGKRLMPRPGEVDFIAGGFPCQSFSGMNHQRQKSGDDIRTTLVANMLSYVDLYRPRFVLMENVKGLLQHHSKIGRLGSSEDIADNVEEVKMSIVKLILRTLLHMGYQVRFRVLEAADYGSPQRRERVIFIAARCGEILPSFPLPTHVTESHHGQVLTLPTGDKLRPVGHPKQQAPFRALTVADAISDLPKFSWIHPGCRFGEELDSSISADCEVLSAVTSPNHTLVGFPAPVAYRTGPLTRYQQNLRASEQLVTLHCSRTFQAAIVERVWHICSHKHPKPTDLPEQFWTRALKAAIQNNNSQEMWKRRFACRLQWDKPFNTALTQCRPFSKGTSVLHPTQKRIITARECARSQGFPDDYHFVQETDCEDWSKLLDDIHKQIGNAVPVPLARALGRSIGVAILEKWRNL